MTSPVPDPDGSGPAKGTNTTLFVPDDDPTTTTNPNDPDTDEGGIPDGNEDIDRDGRIGRDGELAGVHRVLQLARRGDLDDALARDAVILVGGDGGGEDRWSPQIAIGAPVMISPSNFSPVAATSLKER